MRRILRSSSAFARATPRGGSECEPYEQFIRLETDIRANRVSSSVSWGGIKTRRHRETGRGWLQMVRVCGDAPSFSCSRHRGPSDEELARRSSDCDTTIACVSRSAPLFGLSLTRAPRVILVCRLCPCRYSPRGARLPPDATLLALRKRLQAPGLDDETIRKVVVGSSSLACSRALVVPPPMSRDYCRGVAVVRRSIDRLGGSIHDDDESSPPPPPMSVGLSVLSCRFSFFLLLPEGLLVRAAAARVAPPDRQLPGAFVVSFVVAFTPAFTCSSPPSQCCFEPPPLVRTTTTDCSTTQLTLRDDCPSDSSSSSTTRATNHPMTPMTRRGAGTVGTTTRDGRKDRGANDGLKVS